MELEVLYEDGEPVRVEYFSMVYGLMKFHVEGDVAVVDDRWNHVSHENLNVIPQVETEDVIREVEKLPFITEVSDET